MKQYDAVVVLGSQPSINTWKFPKQVYQCLDLAKKCLENGETNHIVTSGMWSIAIENAGLVQPFRECDAMAEYLFSKGVAKRKIIREESSKDVISNLYHLKTEVFIPRDYKKILFIAADFRVPRIKFLCQRILGDDYEFSFKTVAAQPSASYNEPLTFRIQQEFLEPMKDGDHTWLADKFYTAPMYKYWTKHDRQKYSQQS